MGLRNQDDKRWLVCGGRDFGDLRIGRADPRWNDRVAERNFVVGTLESIAHERSGFYIPHDNWLPSDIIIIAGGARGADECAIEWAVVNWCRFQEFPADWDKYGKAAGMIRNRQMLEEGKPDLVIAFPGGRGTAGMVTLARKAGVETIVVPYQQAGQPVHSAGHRG
jgi:hypothetical protein